MRLFGLVKLCIARMLVFVICGQLVFAQIDFVSPNESIYTTSQDEILQTDDITDNPLRQGAADIVDNPAGEQLEGDLIRPVDGIEQDFDRSINDTLALIQRIINYVLGLVALVALVYLLYHGVMLLTSQQDDVVKTAGGAIRTAAIALAWLAVSWFVVSFIFRVVTFAVGG